MCSKYIFDIHDNEKLFSVVYRYAFDRFNDESYYIHRRSVPCLNHVVSLLLFVKNKNLKRFLE